MVRTKNIECFGCAKNARNVESCNNSANSNSISIIFLYTNINMASLNEAFLSYLPKPSQNNCPYFLHRSNISDHSHMTSDYKVGT